MQDCPWGWKHNDHAYPDALADVDDPTFEADVTSFDEMEVMDPAAVEVDSL